MNPTAEQWAAMEPEKRRLVEKVLIDKGVDPAKLPIDALLESEAAPLSLAQERLSILARMDPEATVYNETYRATFDAPALDADAFARAWRRLAERQRLLRSRFAAGEAPDAVELRADGAEPPITVLDLRADDDPEAAFTERVDAEARAPFDLEHGPVARAVLARLADERWGFVLALHHIVCDGASILLIANELSALYAEEIGADRGATDSTLPELPIQYADYARWQRRVQAPFLDKHHLGAWIERLEGAPTVLSLPSDRPRPPVQSYRGDTVHVHWPAPLGERVARFGRDHGATPFMVLLAAYGALLGRLTGQHDLLVGTPVDTRDRDELRSLVGFFVNTLALRIDLSGEPDAATLVERVRDMTLDAFDRRAVPFAEVVEKLAPPRSAEHAPLVQVLFLLQPTPAEVDEAEGLALGLRPVENETSKFDLTAVLRPVDGGFDVALQYATDLFERATMERFADQFRTLVEGLTESRAETPSRSVWDLPLLTAEERDRLAAWNATADDALPADRTWYELFEEQAAATPDAPAIEAGDAASPEILSYRQLAERANRLGHRLRELGVGPEVPVGVSFGHGTDMVAALLGILAAGGAYVPLDPAYPAERLRLMVEDARLDWILADAASRDALPEMPARVAVLDGETLDTGDDAGDGPESFADRPAERPPGPRDPDGLAYLIFTSGSTGRPKAVMAHHRGLVNLSLNFVETFRLGPGERLLMMLSLSFDASVGDIFPPLVSGATVVLHPRPSALAGSELWRELEERRISVIELAAVFWQQWVDELARRDGRVPSSLRTVVTGGDSADVEKARAWFAMAGHATRVLNNYGPTEATVCSAYLPIDGSEDLDVLTTGRLPIGLPMRNIEVHVCDERGQALPVGVPGELVIGGRGVTRGYFGRPGATAENFVPDAFSGREGARLYRTGDLARRLPDGNLEFLGRIDHQAKIRGFRIEPGEIEVALVEHPAVREAIVQAIGARPEDRRLVAYLVAEPDADAPDLAELRSFLADRLPAHMVPSAVVALDALPMTATGKVDRKALPDPAALDGGERRYAPPRNRIEELAAAAWTEVLGLERIGIFDNVFDLGGHSLLVLRVKGRLEEALDREIPVLDFFRFPTIDALARHLSGEAEAATALAPTLGRRRRAETEAIAIVGVAGRFPDAPDVETFWRHLRDGVESITTFTDKELLAAGYTAEDLALPDLVRAKGVLAGPEVTAADEAFGIEYFDAAHFGFHPREAELLDPQHRHFLEVAWEALERAGHDPVRFAGAIGVFAGCGRNAYLFGNLWGRPELLQRAGIAQTMIGNDKDFLPTRVSYKLGLGGPSFAVQSACSTSLVATHIACRSLVDGECDMALAGGVTLPVPQVSAQVAEAGGIFSPDGHCRAFAADAQGTVPGSGAGVVVLRRLDDALADGDHVHAVILASAVSNDGEAKVGYTAPGIDGQVRALAGAVERAGVDPATVGFVETHGTGTTLGDAIEIEGLHQVYGRDRRTPLRLGAVKSNIGHLDTAAGVAGLIKATLAVEHGHIPPSLHCAEPNPALDLERRGLELVPAPVKWTAEGPRRAGVSSFGLGGTNAHVILEQAPERPPSNDGRRLELLVLSARVRSALDRATDRLADHLDTHPDLSLADVAYTLQTGRREMDHRRVLVAESIADAVAALRGSGRARTATCEGRARGVAFLFPGQGAQYPAMARRLYAEEPEVRRWLDRAADAFSPHIAEDLRALIGLGDAERVDGEQLARTDLTQAALFAVEHAIGRLLVSWHLLPTAMLGHSIGEWAAACLAGTVDFDDAVRLVAARGRAMAEAKPGAMLAVSIDAESLAERLAGTEVELAAINGEALCTVAGPAAAIDALAEGLAADKIGHRPLHVSHAFHSASMDGAADAFRAAFADASITLRPPSIPWVSNVTGTWITDEEAVDPGYWARQLRSTVRFADGLATLVERQVGGAPPVLLEVGPGNTLTSLARRALDRPDLATTMAHPKQVGDELGHLLEGVGDMWLAGVAIDWRAVHGTADRRRVALPTYPFERRRFWIEPAEPVLATASGAGAETLDEASAAPASDAAEDAERADGRHGRPELRRDYAPPEGALEGELVELWQELFGIEPIGRDDDFFELGGHSLMAVRLLDQVKRTTGHAVGLDGLFAAPTIAGLAAALDQVDGRTEDEPPIVPVPRDRPLPVSSIQEEYCRLVAGPHMGEHPFKAAAAYRGRGAIDPRALGDALRDVLDRHEILRTTFTHDADGWHQHVHDDWPQEVRVVELGELSSEEQSAEVERRALDAYHQPVDLRTGPFFTLELLRLADDDWVLIRTIHRLVYDGHTAGFLFGDLATAYQARLHGEAPDLPVPELHYGDYAQWEAERLESGAWNRHRDYWHEQLDGAKTELDLRTDRPHPAIRRGRGDHRTIGLPAAAAERFAALARDHGASLFHTLASLYFPLLHHWSDGQDDLTIATPISLRQPQLDAVPGRFLAPVLVRVRLDGDPTFPELIHRVRDATLASHTHRAWPLDRIVDAMGLRDSERRPLAQVALVIQEVAATPFVLDGIEMVPIPFERKTSDYELNLTLIREPDGTTFDGFLEYDTDLFDDSTADWMVRDFDALVAAVSADPECRLSELVSAIERSSPSS